MYNNYCNLKCAGWRYCLTSENTAVLVEKTGELVPVGGVVGVGVVVGGVALHHFPQLSPRLPVPRTEPGHAKPEGQKQGQGNR